MIRIWVVFSLFSFGLGLAAVRGVSGQKPAKVKTDTRTLCSETTALDGEWKRVDFQSFSICLPANVVPVPKKCIDSRCYEFDGGTFRVYIDVTLDAFRPSHERDLFGYWQKTYWLNESAGESAWLWKFEDSTRTDRFNSGALFKRTKSKPLIVGIMIVSNASDPFKIAGSAFSTFKFSSIELSEN